jgi:hypothetical protein
MRILERSSRLAGLRDRPIGNEWYKHGKREFLCLIETLETYPDLPEYDRLRLSANIIRALEGKTPLPMSTAPRRNDKPKVKEIGGKVWGFLGTALGAPISSVAQSRASTLSVRYKDDADFIAALPELASAHPYLIEPASKLRDLALESIKQTRTELIQLGGDVLRKRFFENAKELCKEERAHDDQVLRSQCARQYFEWLNTFNAPGHVTGL